METINLGFSHCYLTSYGYKEFHCCTGYVVNSKRKQSVGYCKYYSTDLSSNVVYIEYIHINKTHRRKGYATQFVKELQRKYVLDWDHCFTDDGRKWYETLVKRKIV